MFSSRNLYDLHPFVAAHAVTFIARAELELGCKLLITCTLRDEEAQNELYAQGRTKPGRVVTNAKAGESAHNYGLAFDIVPLVAGKPMWDAEDPIWQDLGRIGKECGFEWAGDWRTFREYPHFQMVGGLTMAELKNGQSPQFA
jgi:peptidoglycan L-alanyl-D-glutamate endopeptidase CwlK